MKRQTHIAYVLGALLTCAAAPAAAQITEVAVPTSVEILVLPAAGDPLTVLPVTNGARFTPIGVATNCNLAAAAAGPTPLINPAVAEFDDPFTAGRKCRVPMPTNLPNGDGYRAVAIFRTAPPGPSSGRSAVGIPPFDIRGTLVPPAAPTGVVVRP